MLLSARILQHVSSVNDFEYADVAEFTEGDTVDLYIQLIDASVDKADKGFVPGGRRYIPAAGASLNCTLTSINSANTISRAATQPFANDTSIWKLAITGADTIVGFRDLKITLTEGAKVTNGVLRHALNATSLRSDF